MTHPCGNRPGKRKSTAPTSTIILWKDILQFGKDALGPKWQGLIRIRGSDTPYGIAFLTLTDDFCRSSPEDWFGEVEFPSNPVLSGVAKFLIKKRWAEYCECAAPRCITACEYVAKFGHTDAAGDSYILSYPAGTSGPMNLRVVKRMFFDGTLFNRYAYDYIRELCDGSRSEVFTVETVGFGGRTNASTSFPPVIELQPGMPSTCDPKPPGPRPPSPDPPSFPQDYMVFIPPPPFIAALPPPVIAVPPALPPALPAPIPVPIPFPLPPVPGGPLNPFPPPIPVPIPRPLPIPVPGLPPLPSPVPGPFPPSPLPPGLPVPGPLPIPVPRPLPTPCPPCPPSPEPEECFDMKVENTVLMVPQRFPNGVVVRTRTNLPIPTDKDGRSTAPLFQTLFDTMDEVLRFPRVVRWEPDGPVITQTGSSFDVQLPDGIWAWQLNISTIAEGNPTAQYGGGVAPNARIMGWYAEAREGQALGPRINISYTPTGNKPMGSISRLVITLYTGNTGTLTVTPAKIVTRS